MSYPAPFLYHSELSPTNNTSPKKAVIILPEIFGLTKSMRGVADRFAEEFDFPSFALDFFYAVNHEQNDFDYKTEGEKGMTLMQQLTAEMFLDIFRKTREEVKTLYPSVTEFLVCGFCFGGKLAYLSGIESDVTEIISFYGSRSTLPFYGEKSVVEALAESRLNDKRLTVTSFYGNQDSSIPAEDREKRKHLFQEAGINNQEYVFETGHAFFNVDRETYNKKAALDSWEIVKAIIDK